MAPAIDLARMDYDALRLFLKLSRTLHFTRTSRASGVSLSGLSRTIQRLEEEVGQPLFVRDQKTVTLTPAGQIFAEHAAETLARFESLKQRLQDSGEKLSGTISIFASVTAVQSFLPRVLSRFRTSYPEVHIELETGHATDALANLEQGRVDVTIAALPDRIPPALEARVIVVTPLVMVAPASDCDVSRSLEKKPVAWGEVPMVFPAAGLARAAADRWFSRRRLRPKVYGEVSGNEAILSLVSLGCGVGIVPRLVYEKSPLKQDLRLLDVEPRLSDFRVGVCVER
ncbi:MAG TPA: HTH-type transcriptional activator IlvY, partial [Polyangiaceae bacterium]|nr:HTH-type transcriptional activator IlvY [Polyangiaceae bacterium]